MMKLVSILGVYENQKNDVHPPLYYLLLRIAMGINKGHFSKWTGIVPNIIIYVFITIFIYLIVKKLLKDEKNSGIKSAIVAFMSSVTLASLSNVTYIRMYSLLALEVTITAYLHIKLLESEKINPKLLIAIGICALAGLLTHYYYIFYLAFVYLIFAIKYIKEKNIKLLIYYTLTMLASGIAFLLIFPYSIQHIFFGYRGQSVMDKIKNLKELLPSIVEQIHNLDFYGFNYGLIIIVILAIIILLYNKIHKKGHSEISEENKNILRSIYIPSALFFALATVASPWNVLRYIVPVFSLIFASIIYKFYKLLQTNFAEKTSNILIAILFCIILITPFVFKLQPELSYIDRREIVEKLEGELNLPTVYLFNSQKSRFLDDILLFTLLDESYIAKNIDYTKENLENIFENHDISNGIIVFINEGNENEKIVNKVAKYLNFESLELIKGLNSCDVYYLK